MGHDVIVFREKEIYITEYNRSEDESVGEWNDQDDEYETSDTRYNTYDGIEELEDDKVVVTLTNNDDDHNA